VCVCVCVCVCASVGDLYVRAVILALYGQDIFPVLSVAG
jgi:hypothetical protein